MNALIENIDTRQFGLLLLGCCSVILALVATGLLLPEIKSYLNASKEVARLHLPAQDGEDLEGLLQEKADDIAQLKHSLYGDLADLPVKEVEAFVIGRLQKISWANNVDLVSVEPASGEEIQIFQEVLFKVKLSGNYVDLYQWLWDAKNELGFVVIKEYALSRADTVNVDPRLVADLSLASYRAMK